MTDRDPTPAIRTLGLLFCAAVVVGMLAVVGAAALLVWLWAS